MKKIIPDVIDNQNIVTVSSSTSALAIAKIMKEKRIAAVLVTENNNLLGIITERDITTRVVALEGDPNKVYAHDIMTNNPDTLKPDDTPYQAIKMMIARNYRHLPVKDGNQILGLVSIRDLYAVNTKELWSYNKELKKEIKDQNIFIQGESYGIG